MLGKKLALDIGTDAVRLAVRGDPTILSEPAQVVLTAKRGWYGTAALQAAQADPSLTTERPLRGSRVESPEALDFLIHQLVGRAVGRQRIFKPDAVVAVPSALSGSARRGLLDSLASAGTRTAYLLDSPMAVALGGGVPFSGPRGNLVIDIGAGHTEIAVLAMEGCAAGRTVAGGTEGLSRDIAERVQQMGAAPPTTAIGSALLEQVASAAPHDERQMSIPRAGDGEATVVVTARDLAPVVTAFVESLVTAASGVLAEVHESLRQTTVSSPGTVAGGGAHLDGLADRLGDLLEIRLAVVAQPTLCCVRGASVAAESLDVLKRNLMYIR